MNWTRFFCFYSLLMVAQVTPTWGQQFTRPDNKIAREGNMLYKNGSFDEATKKYQESLGANNQNAYANYNMGTTLFKLGKVDSALTYFNNAIHQTDNKTLQSKAFYNAGNVFLQKKEYAKAIEQYKNSLKAFPSNEDARYNLKYAQQLLQQQQQQQDKDKEQNKDKKDNKEQEQNKDQQNKDNNKDQEKDKQDQPAADQNNLSKEQAERMLNAIENKEKELQKKYNEQQNATRRNNEKNW